MLKILEFETCDVGVFLVFGVPNAKYLKFGTPDASALKLCAILPMMTIWFLLWYCLVT